MKAETGLSHERLLRLYREVTGRSAAKGQLPYSTDWFLSWQPNIFQHGHAGAEPDEVDGPLQVAAFVEEAPGHHGDSP